MSSAEPEAAVEEAVEEAVVEALTSKGPPPSSVTRDASGWGRFVLSVGAFS